MRRFLFISLIAVFAVTIVRAQSEVEAFQPSGKAFGSIHWNYHFDLGEDASPRNTFQLTRAYLGYKYKMSEDISLKVTFDGSANGGVTDYTVFLKAAQLDWKVASPLKLSLGLIGTKQFKTQEKLFGYRYVSKTVQDQYGFGSSADFGVNAEYKLMDNLKANLFILNGEGYKKVQDNDGRMRVGGSLVYEPVDGLTVQAFYDNYGGNVRNDSNVVVEDTASIHTLSFHAGYKSGNFRVGAEYNIQNNGTKYNRIAEGHSGKTIALFGAYTISDKFELFGEWFNYKSNTLEGATESWNAGTDGNFIVAGAQYSPVKGLKCALNYRTNVYDADGKDASSLIYINCQFSF